MLLYPFKLACHNLPDHQTLTVFRVKLMKKNSSHVLELAKQMKR